ncbi:TPA: hypothetical protein G8V52_000675 [Salmonella enterica]|nr:hypothetical protein [Salmonella enterica]
MGKVTFVVYFGDGEEPAVSMATEILGGRLSAVLWADYRDDFFCPEQRDVVIEALNELACDEVDEDCHSEIIQKMELMTL